MDHVVARKQDIEEPTISSTGEKIFELIGGRSGLLANSQNQSLAHVTIQPGEGSPAHSHKVCDEIYYILSGDAVITLDGESIEVSAGDAIFIRLNVIHQIQNNSEHPLDFLCICCPAFDPADYFLAEQAE